MTEAAAPQPPKTSEEIIERINQLKHFKSLLTNASHHSLSLEDRGDFRAAVVTERERTDAEIKALQWVINRVDGEIPF